MSTIASNIPESRIWSAPSAFPKLHSRAREVETTCCAGFTITKSLECIEIPQFVYESCDALGLFSQDPIGFAGGDANLYRYVGNHPTMATDPTGLWEFGFPVIFTMGPSLMAQKHAEDAVKDAKIVWRNTSHMNTPQRVYVTGGLVVANEVGVRGISDAFSRNDAVDAHEQSVLERTTDGVFGSIQLVSTAAGMKVKLPSFGNRLTLMGKSTNRSLSFANSGKKEWVFIGDEEQYIKAEKWLNDSYEEFVNAGGRVVSTTDQELVRRGKKLRGLFEIDNDLPQITLSRSQTYGTEFEELYHFQQYLWYKLERQMPNKLLSTEKMKDAVELEAEMFMSMMGFCKM